jgi:hypothetical protein
MTSGVQVDAQAKAKRGGAMRRLLACGLLLGLSGCFTTAMYRTAHILPEGEGDFAMNFSVARVRTDAYREGGVEFDADTFMYPNVIPELSYHFGLAEDFEFGGRVALGAGLSEIDGKLRVLGGDTDRLNVAVQPALAYQGWGLAEGYRVAMPLILTYNISDRLFLNTAAFASYTSYNASESLDNDEVNLGGDYVIAGGALGIQFETKSGFYAMPGVEVQRMVVRTGDFEDVPKLTAVLFGVTLGWGADKTYAKLEEVERKVDKIDGKLDQVLEQTKPQ